MSTEADHIDYIKGSLIKLIEKRLSNETILDFDVQCSTGLNGFMSAIYTLQLKTKDNASKRENGHEIIVKFMKGDKEFREFGRVYTQFANEIYIYSTVIPYYEKVIQGAIKSSIKTTNWIPTVYTAQYGKIEGLNSSLPESVLALENLKPLGFRNGPRLHLDREHLRLMAQTLAEYHSLTYALRIRKDPQLQQLIDGIIPFPFVCKEGRNLYGAIYPPAFNRFFAYFDKVKDSLSDADFVDNVGKFRRNYGIRPLDLLERFRKIDEIFSVIEHGDFNRNNVLFQYGRDEGFANPQSMRMIDFQELRYGSPAMDISFFMYMNMEPEIRNDFWLELLKFYHSTLIKSMADILEIDVEHENLKPYSFDKFYEHFSKFAFYGVLICIHFVPWVACSEEDCAELSDLFEKDMYGEAFNAKAFSAGGDHANEIVFEVVQHASRQGYMKNIFD